MDSRKLHLVLNQRLNDVWSVEGITIDNAVLSGAVEEWDSLALGVKVNLLCSLLGLRNKAPFLDGLMSVTRAAAGDKDEWVRVMGQMLEPLLRDPPERVALTDPVFAATVRQITSMLQERGEPAWRPAFQSYLETAQPEAAEPNNYFVVPPAKRLAPLRPHADPDSLLPSAAPALPTASHVRLTRPTAVPLERKMGSGLRGTSTLLDKKPYQQKKTVKALTAEQVAELARKETHSEAKRQANMVQTPHQIMQQQQQLQQQQQQQQQQLQQREQLQDDLVAGLAEEPLQKQVKRMEAVMEDLSSLTSVTTAVQPVSMPSSSKDADVAAGLMGLWSAPEPVLQPVATAARQQFDLSTATALVDAADRDLVERMMRGESIDHLDPTPGFGAIKTVVLRDEGANLVVMDVNFGTEKYEIKTVPKQ